MNCPVEGQLKVIGEASKSTNISYDDYSVSWENGILKVLYKNHVIYETEKNKNFIGASKGEMKVTEARGSFTIEDKLHLICPNQVVSKVEVVENSLSLSGFFAKNRSRTKDCPGSWNVSLNITSNSCVILMPM